MSGPALQQLALPSPSGAPGRDEPKCLSLSHFCYRSQLTRGAVHVSTARKDLAEVVTPAELEHVATVGSDYGSDGRTRQRS